VYTEYGITGKVVKGDPTKPEDVIAYVVFERCLKGAENTSWKICGKLPSQVPWKEMDQAMKERRKIKKLKHYKTQGDRDRLKEDLQKKKTPPKS